MPWPTKKRKSEEQGEDKGASSAKKAASDSKAHKEAGSSGFEIPKEKKDGRLPYSFFDRPCEELAKKLLGQKLVRKLEDGSRVAGKIVETEAYLGGEDKGAHSAGGKRSAKNEAMFMAPGTAYVYHIYGVYTCMNISSKGDGAAVLIRALDPLEGEAEMKKLRGTKRPDGGKGLRIDELCSGPSKLTQALAIDKASINKTSLLESDSLWLEKGDSIKEADTIVTARVNIDYAEEWKDKPLRFYVKGNQSVSVLDKDQDDTKKRSRGWGKSSSSTSKPIAPYEAGSKLTSSFFDQPALDLAKALLGQYIVRVLDGDKKVVGRIVETEAYLGLEDGASQCYGGKKNAKTNAMFMAPGTAFVYHTQFTYYNFNISSKGEGHVVCIRAMEPVKGGEHMRALRGAKKADKGASLEDDDLCSGPAKVCQAFKLDKNTANEKDLTKWDGMWLEKGQKVDKKDIVSCVRVGLENIPKEWQFKPWRFYVRDSSCVSSIDKTAEASE